ncbi:hypothetical protein OIO90_001904 [Microbotryomycetes sp. JL221]|nr:hypothetical protein OIO90_001904 [Microbotryomycetes sp. JL221]
MSSSATSTSPILFRSHSSDAISSTLRGQQPPQASRRAQQLPVQHMPSLYTHSSTAPRAPSPRTSTQPLTTSLSSSNVLGGGHQHKSSNSSSNQHQFGGLSTGLPHPQYPFLPSPHPHNGPVGMLGFNHAPTPYPVSSIASAPLPNLASPGAQQQTDPHTTARMVHQAQLQQQQWHMDMMLKHHHSQSNVIEWQQQQQQQATGQRQRTRSGPTPSTPSPQFYTTPLPYPPSPSPTLHYKSLSNTVPSMPLPPGALGHQFGHGYPTPPGSVERGESSASVGPTPGAASSSRDAPYHPYRRVGDGRSSSQPRHGGPPTVPSHHATTVSSGSSNVLHNPRHLRADSGNSSSKPSPTASTTSSSSLYTSSYSTGRDVNSSSTSVNSTSNGGFNTASGRSSARSTPPPPPMPALGSSLSRARSDNQLPRAETKSSFQHDRTYSSSTAASSSSSRSNSFESARATTPIGHAAPAGKKPSPLSQQQYESRAVAQNGETNLTSRPSSEMERPGTPGTLRGPESREQDEDSDDTAGGDKKTRPVPVRAATIGEPADAGGKEKKGVKSRFKKAFGMSSAPSSSSLAPTLTESELNGKGPKVVRQQRVRSGSVSSGDSATTRQSGYMAPVNDGPSSGGSKKAGRPPTVASTRKFGLLNSKFNSSTDNLSISSTVSSASMLIRKLGNVGKMARRNSFMNLTKAFKNKDKDGEEQGDVIASSTGANGAIGGKGHGKKKSVVSGADVSHVQAEIDRESTPSTATAANGMSPAAALARQHQEMYAEQEAAEAAAKAERERLEAMSRMLSSGPHARQDSDAASIKSSRSLGNWGRSNKDDSKANGMLQKEKDKVKKSKGKRWGFGSSNGSTNNSVRDGDSNSFVESVNDDAAGGHRSSSALGYYNAHRQEHASGIEVLNQPAYATYGGTVVDEPKSSTDEARNARQAAQQEQRRHARPAKSILKGAGSYNQEEFALPKPSFVRTRATSFDAPLQSSAPGPAGSVALVGTIPSEAQVDGVVPASTAPRSDAPPPSDTHATPLERPVLAHHGISAPTAIPLTANMTNVSSPYGHPALNVSAPTLAHFNKFQPVRSASAPGGTGRRITFATSLSVHTTWPANIYDRRAEPATCNRLTPLLAQQIKEELNSYKMEEMDVHPSSRALTHFFV